MLVDDEASYFIDPEDQECKETIEKYEEKVGSAYGRSHAL